MTDFSFHNQVAETTQVGTQFPALSTSRKHRTAGECLFFFIVLTTLVAGAGDVEIFGANLCGLSWISSLLVSLLSLLFIRSGKISFPFLSWLPFFGYVLLRSDVLSRNDLQRLAIMITPIIVAVALSRLPVKNLRLVRKLYYAVLIVTTCNFLVAVIEGGSSLGYTSWNIPQGFNMTLVLVAIAGIVDWAHGLQRGLITLAISWLLCALTLSRMAVLTIPALLVAAPLGLSRKKKGFVAIILFLGAIAVFNTPPIQKSIFHTGSGTLDDALTFDPKVVNMGGRLNTWPYYIDKIKEQPWFGYGGTASSDFGRFILNWAAHPHNEYIRLTFDYGLVGIILFFLPFFRLMTICYRRMYIGSADARWLYAVGTGGLLAFLLLAMTGNTLLYVAWFGNLLFATIGAAFSYTQAAQSQ